MNKTEKSRNILEGVLRIAGVLAVTMFFMLSCSGGGAGSSGSSGGESDYSASGQVIDSTSGLPVSGVSIHFSGDVNADTTTDEYGLWSQSGLSGTVSITPAKDDWSFTPASIEISEETADMVFVRDDPPETVANPTATPGPGEVAAGTEVTLSVSTAGAAIYYTLNGSDPKEHGVLYSGPIQIDEDLSILAYAEKAGMLDSEVTSFMYTIEQPPPVVPPTGIYAGTSGGLSFSADGGLSFVNRTTTDGLGSDSVNGVFVTSEAVYAATSGGLSISTDGGETFTNRTTSDGLGSIYLYGVQTIGSTVYAASDYGLSISNNGGVSFSNRTTADGLGENSVRDVYVEGSTVFAATNGGLSISTDGGETFTNRTTDDGLASNDLQALFVSGSTVYAATDNGLSVSSDGGNSFMTIPDTSGLDALNIKDVHAEESVLYVAAFHSGFGLYVSDDGGDSFTKRTEAGHGFYSSDAFAVYASGSNVYVGTNWGGLAVSADGADSFVYKTETDGLGHGIVKSVFVKE
jgi:hypothetical protein